MTHLHTIAPITIDCVSSIAATLIAPNRICTYLFTKMTSSAFIYICSVWSKNYLQIIIRESLGEPSHQQLSYLTLVLPPLKWWLHVHILTVQIWFITLPSVELLCKCKEMDAEVFCKCETRKRRKLWTVTQTTLTSELPVV